MIAFFTILVLLHFFLYLKKFLRICLYRPIKTSEKPGFSVIVCAHNEEENLRTLAPLLLGQRYENFEIIIVLDRSTDQSQVYLDKLQGDSPILKVISIERVPEGWNGKKYGITTAIKEASFDWILLTDADCRPASEDWIQSFASLTASSSVILGIGAYKKEKGLLNQFIQYETLLTAFFYSSSAIAHRPYMGVGRNLAYQKSVFDKVNGFDGFCHVTGGDDDLLVQKINPQNETRVVFGEKTLTISLPKRKWREYLDQKLRHLHAGKYYKVSVQWMHSFNSSGHLLLWLSFLYLVFKNIQLVEVVGVFAIMLILKGIFLQVSAGKMGLKFDFLFLPLVDLIYAIFIPVVGIQAALLKKVKWI